VLIVDDHVIVREGLATLLSDEEGIDVVGQAADATTALRLLDSHQPDVILMDLVLPGMDGIELTHKVRAAYPESRVLVLTSFADDERVRRAIQAGAIGYLLKDVLKPDLLHAIHAAAQGRVTLHPEVQQLLMQHVAGPEIESPLQGLTGREMEVLRLIAQGNSNKEIASALHLTEGTVKGYVSAILDKLQVEDRTQAALVAVRNGLA
jgi:NarL family two-component system response regulator LiaR